MAHRLQILQGHDALEEGPGVNAKEFLEQVIHGERKFMRFEQNHVYRRSDYITPTIQKIVDISNHPVANHNNGYAYKVRLSNLQKMADTLNYLSSQKISGIQEIRKAAF